MTYVVTLKDQQEVTISADGHTVKDDNTLILYKKDTQGAFPCSDVAQFTPGSWLYFVADKMVP